MKVIIQFELDPLIKLEGAAKHMFEIDIEQLADAYATRDSIQISYEEDYVPEHKQSADDAYNEMLADEVLKHEAEEKTLDIYSRDSDDRPIDP